MGNVCCPYTSPCHYRANESLRKRDAVLMQVSLTIREAGGEMQKAHRLSGSFWSVLHTASLSLQKYNEKEHVTSAQEDWDGPYLIKQQGLLHSRFLMRQTLFLYDEHTNTKGHQFKMAMDSSHCGWAPMCTLPGPSVWIPSFKIKVALNSVHFNSLIKWIKKNQMKATLILNNIIHPGN